VSDFSSGLIVVGIVVLLALVLLLRTVRIVPQAFEGVVERLGRYSRTLPAGLHVLIPFLDHLRPFVDMREQVVTFPPQPVITEDNVTISIDVVIYYQITDAVRATYEVANLVLAMEQLSVTTLRNVIGSLSLEQTLTSRDKINAELRIVMDDATEKWGVRVNRIELKSIDPPASIQEAMEKQMRAERSKRATVLEAEGEKQSQILRAEGDRQGAILRAEAQKQSQILEAEGDREAAILRAEGESQAIQTVFSAIHAGNPTPDLLALKYIEALPQLAQGQASSLFLIPSDVAAALGGLATMGAAFRQGGDVSAGGSPPATT
jgi:regulator of protease activity HflC (stomatin/prohibitin superfamily)